MDKIAKNGYHSFEVIPLEPGKILVQRGYLYYFKDGIQRYDVTGATKDILMGDFLPIGLLSGETINVLIKHSSKEATSQEVDIETCRLTNQSSSSDANTETIVNVATVIWTGNIARVEQILSSDIYCLILGTKNE